MRGKLKEQDERKIRSNWMLLLEELDGEHVVNQLFQKNIITLDDMHQVKAEKTPRRRTEALLKVVLHAGPGAAFDEFVSALKETYPHIADKLS